MTNEIVSVLKKADFVKEFSKFAEDHKFKISAEVEVVRFTDSQKKPLNFTKCQKVRRNFTALCKVLRHLFLP